MRKHIHGDREGEDRDDLDSDRLEADRSAASPADAEGATREDVTDAANPPRTTTGKITAPKFGSAGSGGAEFEGPLRKD